MRKMLVFLPLLSLIGCSSSPVANNVTPYITHTRGIATVYTEGSRAVEDHTTYLMVSRYGSVNVNGKITQGSNFTLETATSTLYFEYAVKWVSPVNSPLPTAEEVSSSVKGATFRGWAYYADNAYPEYLKTVPQLDGERVYAIFDGDQSTPPTPTPEDYQTYFINSCPDWIWNDGATIFAWCWGSSSADDFYPCTNLSATSLSFEAPFDITGYLLVRCPAGTLYPDWNAKGDVPGRIYNQTEDGAISGGQTTYISPSWKEYNPEW